MKKNKLLEENESLKLRLEELKKEKFKLDETIKKEKLDNVIKILSSLGHLDFQHDMNMSNYGFEQKITFTLTM